MKYSVLNRLAKVLAPAEFALGVSLAVFWAYNTGSLLLTSLGSLIAWKGFSIAHYAYTGRIVDDSDNSHASKIRYDLLITGFLMMAWAFPTVVVGMHHNSFGIIFLGELMFISGHMIGHYGTTETFF